MRILILLLLVTAAFAGCAGDPEASPDNTADGDTADGGDTSGDGDTVDGGDTGDAGDGVVGNASIIPILEIDADNGTAPFVVSFSLDAQNFTSGTWLLESGLDGNTTELANGTTLPATVEHEFALAGSHAVTFTVNGVATLSRIVNVTAGATGPTDLVTTQELTGSFEAGATDPQSHDFPVPEGAYAVSVWVTWALPEIGEGLVFTDIDTALLANGQEVASAASGSYEWLRHTSDDGIAAGDYTVVLEPFATGVETPYTMQIMVWMAPVQTATFTGEFAGEAAAATEETITESLSLTSPVHAMSGHLQWGTPDSPSCGTANAKATDIDFDAVSGGALFSSGNFGSCEYGFADAADGETLSTTDTVDFVIAPYLAVAAEYLLTVWYV